MPFNNPIVGTGFGTLLRTSIRSLVQTPTLGWSINTNGTATFTGVSTLNVISQTIDLTGSLVAGTTFLYITLESPFGQFLFLEYDTATNITTNIYQSILGQPAIVNYDNGSGGAVDLRNGGRPIYYSKPGLPDLVSSAASVGPTVGAATLVIQSSASITLDGLTRVRVKFECARIDTTVAGDVFTFSFRDNTTVMRTIRYAPGAAAAQTGEAFEWISDTAPTVGAHVFDIAVARNVGAGTLSVVGSATGIRQLVTSELL